MSGTALPWPRPQGVDTADDARNGVTLTAATLAAETGADLARATRVLPVAILAVNEYAPQAPTVAKDEACIRFGGYLLGSDYGAVGQESIGPMAVTYQPNHAAMFRNSGAAALLTRYRVRRAGAI